MHVVETLRVEHNVHRAASSSVRAVGKEGRGAGSSAERWRSIVTADPHHERHVTHVRHCKEVSYRTPAFWGGRVSREAV